MKIHAGLPKTFWVDTINTIVYLINKEPLVPLDCTIPYLVWSSKKVYLPFSKVFTCLFYVHIYVVAISKLDLKSNKCFFIGYGDTKFGYHFWMTKIKRLSGAWI